MFRRNNRKNDNRRNEADSQLSYRRDDHNSSRKPQNCQTRNIVVVAFVVFSIAYPAFVFNTHYRQFQSSDDFLEMDNVRSRNQTVLLKDENNLSSLTHPSNIVIANITITVEEEKEIKTNDQHQRTSCTTTLNDMAIKLATFTTPHGSKSWEKHKHIFSRATQFYVVKPKSSIFDSTTENIILMLSSYGLKKIVNDTLDSDIVTRDGNRTIIIEYLVFQHNSRYYPCIGSSCGDIPRILLQTEQLKRMNTKYSQYLETCYISKNCVVWDFSDSNYHYISNQTIDFNISPADSFMIVPHMFHERVKSLYPEKDQLIPLKDRSLDVVFHGLITKRRKTFEEAYITPSNQVLSKLEIKYEKVMRMIRFSGSYANSKICLVVHSFHADSAGEYHRLSDFNRFGCVPVMERFDDKLTVDTLSHCGGIIFADYDDLPSTIERELKRIDSASVDVLANEQKAVYEWWSKSIEWQSFLENILGPRILIGE